MDMKSELEKLLGKNPVAIIGMASMFAGAKNLEEYWENIVEGVDCITDVPDTRWSIEDYYDPDPLVPDKTYCKVGGFLPDIDFNPMEFGLPPNILEVTDASQLLALLVARDALIDAGYAPGSDKFSAEIKEKTGVVLGVGGGQKLITPLTARLQYPVWRRALQASGIPENEIEGIIEKMKTAYIPWNENSFPGMLGNVISGRVANRFDLGGINSVVDAACAASLSAVKMGLSELIEGRCDMMLTGGVDTDNSPFMYMSFSKTPAFSQKGSIRPFDHESDGMLIGEGVGMVVCKRLVDAVRDGDRIYATIKGIGSSSDGRFKSVYAPRPKGQALAMQRAYDEAGYEASSVGLIEAHGTGTGAGDLSEGESMKMVFGKNDATLNHVALGSVKSQIGHTKAAAGVAGLIKAALALHNKVLPGTINVTKPNPNLNVETSPAYVNSETRPWFKKSTEAPRRASVSAFGFGGVNLHVALEEVKEEQKGKYRTHNKHKIVLLSGDDANQLIADCDSHIEQLRGDDPKDYLTKLSIQSQSDNISKKNARLGFVASDVEEALDKLIVAKELLQEKQAETSWEQPLKGIWFRNKAESISGKVVALFAGQGSQYVNMGKELAMSYPAIRDSFGKTNRNFVKAKEKQLTDYVFPIPVFSDDERAQQEEQLTHTELAQPSIGALTAGMYRLLESAGFTADFYAGHSLGEISALWAAGVIDDKAYYALVKARGAAMGAKYKGDRGSMLAVKSDVSTLTPFIKSFKDVKIANQNSDTQVILGGGTASIKELAEKLIGEGMVAKILPVSAAFHTPFVKHAQKPFAAKIKGTKFKTSKKKVYSNTTGKVYENKIASYKSTLTKHMLSTVLFKEQIENIHKDGGRIFVEFGPKSILSNLVKEILADKEHLSIALNSNAKKDSDVQLREAVVQLVVLGMDLQDFDKFRTEYTEPIPKGSISVKISGNNYVSEPTKQKHIQAMGDVTVRAAQPTTDTNQEIVTNTEEDIEMTKQDRERLDKLDTDLNSLKGQQDRVEQMLQQLVNIQQAAIAPFIQQPIAPLEQAAPPIATSAVAPVQPFVESTPVPVTTPKPAPAPVASQPVAPAVTAPVATPSAPKPSPIVEQAATTPTPAPVSAPPVSAPPAAAPQSGVDNGSIEKLLLEVIAEKT
ncbi:MAG: polyketide-type polyunsaturated fatty acid synthase PfaA, partial [Bacteroidetes bacterium]